MAPSPRLCERKGLVFVVLFAGIHRTRTQTESALFVICYPVCESLRSRWIRVAASPSRSHAGRTGRAQSRHVCGQLGSSKKAGEELTGHALRVTEKAVTPRAGHQRTTLLLPPAWQGLEVGLT